MPRSQIDKTVVAEQHGVDVIVRRLQRRNLGQAVGRRTVAERAVADDGADIAMLVDRANAVVVEVDEPDFTVG